MNFGKGKISHKKLQYLAIYKRLVPMQVESQCEKDEVICVENNIAKCVYGRMSEHHVQQMTSEVEICLNHFLGHQALSSPTQIVLSLYCSNSVAPIHHSQDKLKISQRTNEANVFGPKPIPNIHGIKINGVEKNDKFSPKETRVSTSSSKHVDQHVITNVVPLQMIVHVEITEENKKSALHQKQKKY
ncbi:unnamed protein product [Vicia faba]|uniref:Uncharacterized protein n=1 Tax=Vicia faba TaxID=3906 RepID=A0AAV0Z021_VICFA|nr:unnamed protein product [Vicia faba]